MTRRLNEINKGKNQFGLEISRLLYIKGENQEWLANKCRVSKGYISQIINGKIRPSARVTQLIADLFELNVEDLRKKVLMAS